MSRQQGPADMPDDQFEVYKKKLMPVLYDFFGHYHLRWPTQTCRWGPLLEDAGYKSKYRVYLSEQVNEESSTEPKTLTVGQVEVLKPHVASCDTVANWTEGSRRHLELTWTKVIIHDGDVNKVREVVQHPQLLVTASDIPDHYVWNIDRQPDRRQAGGDGAAGTSGVKDSKPSKADLRLVGHKENAPFAMCCSSGADPRVASGSEASEKDGTAQVLVWDLRDHVTGLNSDAPSTSGGGSNKLQARTRLEGHTDTVGGVCFCPGNGSELVSVGDDERIILWDTRQGTRPASQVEQAHRSKAKGRVALMCVDWSALDPNLMVTGADNGSLRVWDRRRMASHMHHFELHTKEVINVEWHPQAKGVFASGGDDHLVAIWQLGSGSSGAQASTSAAAEAASPGGGRKRSRGDPGEEGGSALAALNAAAARSPPELIFQHFAHRKGEVKDFQWCPTDPWVMMSVQLNTEDLDGGVQLWRINDLIYRPKEEALRELEQHREFLLEGQVPGGGSVPQKVRQGPAPSTSEVQVEGAAAAAAGAGPSADGMDTS